jgi:PAS domain S-box-containing protein
MSAMHRDGTEFPVELAITPIGFGDDLVFSGFIRDITGRVRAEAALRESEQRFRTTANAAPVLIWMSGKDKRCTWFNQRWLDFVGREIEQELGDGWCDNLHPADFDRTLDTYHAAFDARRPYEMEFRLQRDDGAWRWLLERGCPHLGPGGEFVGFIGTCIDITEHRETVEQLRENRARFKTLAESLPQMIWTCLRDGYTDYVSRQWRSNSLLFRVFPIRSSPTKRAMSRPSAKIMPVAMNRIQAARPTGTNALAMPMIVQARVPAIGMASWRLLENSTRCSSRDRTGCVLICSPL